MGDLIRIYEESINANTELKPASIASRLTTLKKIKKTWPELEALKPSQVSQTALAAWAARFKSEGQRIATEKAARKIEAKQERPKSSAN